jgi:hypothetical protein
MAHVILRDTAANKYSLIAARIGPILGRPAKYNETAEILSLMDDDMIATVVSRYSDLKEDLPERLEA